MRYTLAMVREDSPLYVRREDEFLSTDPDMVSDEELAEICIARFCALAVDRGCRITLSATRSSSVPDSEPWGISYTAASSNRVCFTARRYSHALQWGKQAFALGLGVFVNFSGRGMNKSTLLGGTLAGIRDKMWKDRAKYDAWAAREADPECGRKAHAKGAEAKLMEQVMWENKRKERLAGEACRRAERRLRGVRMDVGTRHAKEVRL